MVYAASLASPSSDSVLVEQSAKFDMSTALTAGCRRKPFFVRGLVDKVRELFEG